MQGFLGSVEGHADFVAGDADEISGIKIVDDLTIELTLSQPDVTIPGVLAIPPFYVLPAEEVQAEGEKFQFTMGTGPWKLEEFDQAQRRYRCSRFEDYVYAESLPYFDTLEWEWGITPTLEAQRVQRGELEAMGANVPAATALQLQQGGAGEDTLQLWESLNIVWYEFDVTQPPFDNPLVRRAVNHAFNRDRLQRLLIQPTGHFYPTACSGTTRGPPSTPTTRSGPRPSSPRPASAVWRSRSRSGARTRVRASNCFSKIWPRSASR